MSVSPSVQYRKQFQNKRMKIQRHKVPNLLQPGSKFDERNVVFFGKISNTLKLLEQPMEIKQQLNEIELQLKKIALRRKNTMSKRMKFLSQPKKPENYAEHSVQVKQFISSFDLGQSKINRQKRMSMHNRKSLQKNINDNSITGTRLGFMPIEQILRIKQKQQEEEFKRNLNRTRSRLDGEDDEEEVKEKEKEREYEEPRESLTPIHDNFIEWSQKIIRGQNKLYEHFDKGLMEKVRSYRPKQLKINHQSMWK